MIGIIGSLPTETKTYFPGNFADDLSRKILPGIGWREDGSTSGNCKGEKLCEIKVFLSNILGERNVTKGKGVEFSKCF